MKRIRNLAAMILCALLAFPGCSKKESPAPGTGLTVPQKNRAAAGEIYRGSKYELPDGMSLESSVRPFADPDCIICLASEMNEAEAEDGEVNRSWRYSLVAFDSDGHITATEALEVPDGAVVFSGRITKDGFSLFLADEDNKSVIFTRTASGEQTSGDLTVLLSSQDQQFVALDVDMNGNYWAAAGHEILMLNSDFSRNWNAQVNGYVHSVSAADDGRAWMLVSDGDMYAECIEAGGVFTDRISTPRGVGSLIWANGTLLCDGEYGISSLSKEGETLLADYPASGLTTVTSRLVAAIDTERVLLAKSGAEGYSLYLYHRSDGDEPIEAVSLEVVVALPEGTDTGEGQFWRTQMADFNSSHKDIQVSLTDYAGEWGTEAADALTRDLVTGTIKPDILLGNPWTAYIGTVVERTVVEHGMFRDLTPYLEADPEVNFDTVLAAAIRSCTYRGKVWGIPTAFTASALIAPDNLLGPFAGKSGWTIGNMLDRIEELPADVQPIMGINQVYGMFSLLGENGLAEFIDLEAGVCSFDGPEFLRFVRYLSTLPKDDEEAKRKSSVYAAYRTAAETNDGSGMIEPFHTGKVFLCPMALRSLHDYVGLEMKFGTKDVTLIGYPTATPEIPGSGMNVTPELPMIILNTCENPDAAWTLIKAILGGENQHRNPSIPSLKSSFETKEKNSIGSQAHFFYNGGAFFGDLPSSYAKQPHVTVSVSKDDLNAYRDLLDNAGSAYIGTVPREILDIVNEELTAMTAGVSAPEDCAKKIQSRVSIWLAEHR